jgi:glucokinase
LQYPRTISSTYMRRINRAAILELIRREAPIARSDIARKLNVSLPTVMRIVEDLIDSRLVLELDETEASGGRRRRLLSFNPSENLVIGINMGGMVIFGALADIGGTILAERRMPMSQDAELTLEHLGQMIADFLGNAARAGKNVLGIGIGAPGTTDKENGRVLWAPSLHWRNFPLRDRLQERFPDLPILVDNDVNLAAVGEQWYGAGINYRNIVMVSVGNGVGGAVIIDGVLYRGGRSAAGEVGSFLPGIQALDFKKECFGALEIASSGKGLLDQARARLLYQWSPTELESLNLEMIYAAVQNGEEWGRRILQRMIDELAVLVAGVAAILDPDIIILGGDVMGLFNQNGEVLQAIRERIHGLPPNDPLLVASQLENRGVLMGTITDLLNLTNQALTVREL